MESNKPTFTNLTYISKDDFKPSIERIPFTKDYEKLEQRITDLEEYIIKMQNIMLKMQAQILDLRNIGK